MNKNLIGIPGTDLEVSSICLGTGSLGSTIPPQDAFDLLDEYLALGGNFIDTAKIYADWLPGETSISEKTIGRWMKLRRNRSRVILGTKGAHPELSTMHIGRLSPQEINSDLEASLQNLGTDYIDLYWLHRDDPARPVEEIIETLNTAIRAGKIRYIGCSNWTTARIRQANQYAGQHGLRGFVANQMFWNLAKLNPPGIQDKTIVWMDGEMYAFHRETKMAAVPYSSQAGGWFQKKQQGNNKRIHPAMRELYDSAENEARLQHALQLGALFKLSLTQVVLGYLLSQPFPTIPIVGCQSIAQLRDSMSAWDVRLPEDQVRFLVGEDPFA